MSSQNKVLMLRHLRRSVGSLKGFEQDLNRLIKALEAESVEDVDDDTSIALTSLLAAGALAEFATALRETALGRSEESVTALAERSGISRTAVYAIGRNGKGADMALSTVQGLLSAMGYAVVIRKKARQDGSSKST